MPERYENLSDDDLVQTLSKLDPSSHVLVLIGEVRATRKDLGDIREELARRPTHDEVKNEVRLDRGKVVVITAVLFLILGGIVSYSSKIACERADDQRTAIRQILVIAAAPRTPPANMTPAERETFLKEEAAREKSTAKFFGAVQQYIEPLTCSWIPGDT
jgi:hypothetical protein